MLSIVQSRYMGKLLLLILLYYVIRFVVKYVFPTVKTYNQIKKKVNQQAQTNTKQPHQSLYEDKGEYIDYEEIT